MSEEPQEILEDVIVTTSIKKLDLRRADQQVVTGKHVKQLQGLLAAAGRTVAIDGKAGDETKRELGNFQESQPNLAKDFVVGKETWTALLTPRT